MNQTFGWDSLTDIVSNMLGALMLLSLSSFVAGSHRPDPGDDIGEIPTALTPVRFLCTATGVFPVDIASAIKQLKPAPDARLSRGWTGTVNVASGHGSVRLRFVASAHELSWCLFLRPEGTGCTTDEIRAADCSGYPKGANTRREKLFFYDVYPGGFKDFADLCRDEALLGSQTAWKPRLEGEEAFLCSSGARSDSWLRKQAEGARSIASQSCLWLLQEVDGEALEREAAPQATETVTATTPAPSASAGDVR